MVNRKKNLPEIIHREFRRRIAAEVKRLREQRQAVVGNEEPKSDSHEARNRGADRRAKRSVLFSGGNHTNVGALRYYFTAKAVTRTKGACAA
jgi:hypothetical protein